MRYFVPHLEPHSVDANPQSIEHLGGKPIGLESSAWPKCAECGRSLSFLAQFMHHPERLDLGREGRSLLIFQCNHDPGMCSTWEAFSGANACIVVEPENLGELDTMQPNDNPPIDPCLHIFEWDQREDGLTAEEFNALLGEDGFFDYENEFLQKITWSTRLGGMPRWIQNFHESPGPAWQFLGQLDGTYSFYGAPKFSTPWIKPDADHFEGRTHWAEGPNFGGGIAYLFAQKNADAVRVVMLWQR